MRRRTLTTKDKEEIGLKCCNCGSKEDLQYHHIIPISIGGKDINSNICCLCYNCHYKLHHDGKDKKVSNLSELIKKDVSFIVDNNTTCKTLEDTIKKSGGRLLAEISLFDVYHDNNNEKSLAFSLTFKDNEKTLTDEEVMTIFNKIITDVTTKCNAKLKSI